MLNTEELRKIITEKYGSLHNFCKLHKNLTRATVYLVFSGKYAGNVQKQLLRIENALNDSSEESPKKISLKEEEIAEILQKTKCSNCRLLRPNCLDCKRKSITEAQAVFAFVQAKLQ